MIVATTNDFTYAIPVKRKSLCQQIIQSLYCCYSHVQIGPTTNDWSCIGVVALVPQSYALQVKKETMSTEHIEPVLLL